MVHPQAVAQSPPCRVGQDEAHVYPDREHVLVGISYHLPEDVLEGKPSQAACFGWPRLTHACGYRDKDKSVMVGRQACVLT